MMFANRQDAARQLAQRLVRYHGHRPLVLGLPRGGVPMARIVADAVGGDVDVVLIRKLRAPGQPELAIGAVDERGRIVEGPCFSNVPPDYVRDEVRAQLATIHARRRLYGGTGPAVDPAGRTVVLVDDGVATGSSMLAAIGSVRAEGARDVVIAVGVAPVDTLARLRGIADDVICLYPAEAFEAVGQFYRDFSEVTDADVVASLRRPSARPG